MTINRMQRPDLRIQQTVFDFTEIIYRYCKYYDLKKLNKFFKLFKNMTGMN